MTEKNFILRHLCFVGPNKNAATIEFNKGLNIVYGPSNTGKSSILDAIDFMMGREKKLKDIPEHVGYSEILLGLEFSDGSLATLARSIRGGDYRYLDGLHLESVDGVEHTILKQKTPTKKLNSLSNFLLGEIGLAGKKLKKNAKNGKESLTLRTLLPLFFVNETDIQSERSPFLSGQYTKETVEISRLRMLVTGVDDSSLISEEVLEKEKISRSAKVGVLDELIEGMRKKVLDAASEDTTIEELNEQLEKLEGSIGTANEILETHQSNYYEVLSQKNAEQKLFREGTERLSEVVTMTQRFELLLEHYDTDISRLGGIIESGSLLSALSDSTCPLCGASPDKQEREHDCDGDIERVVEAAEAERDKVALLRRDLARTLEQLSEEKHGLDTQIGQQRKRLDASLSELEALQPDLSAVRKSYSDLVTQRAQVLRAIELFESLGELEDRLAETSHVDDAEVVTVDNIVPESALFAVAKEVQYFLQAWGLPNSDSVHFSSETTDIVINGKHRISNGKGHRSITHSAVNLGLARYLEKEALPQIGFVVLDSPLIAYEEPDEDDEISHTDLNKRFFDSLRDWSGLQTIIFENKKSITDEISSGPNVTHFTKKPNVGRYGFFPIEER